MKTKIVVLTILLSLSLGLRAQEAKLDWQKFIAKQDMQWDSCLLYTSPSPRDGATSRMPSSA